MSTCYGIIDSLLSTSPLLKSWFPVAPAGVGHPGGHRWRGWTVRQGAEIIVLAPLGIEHDSLGVKSIVSDGVCGLWIVTVPGETIGLCYSACCRSRPALASVLKMEMVGSDMPLPGLKGLCGVKLGTLTGRPTTSRRWYCLPSNQAHLSRCERVI